MAQITLSGKLSDVTGQSIDDVSRVSVKASNAIPTSSGVITSRPRDIPVASNGNFSITLETGVKAWIFVEGDGWSDSVPVLAASGMTELWQAIVNALPSTMTGDLLRAIANALDTLRNAEDLVKFDHGPVSSSVTSLADLDIGSHGVASTTVANNLGLPFTQGTLLISRISTGKTIIGIANSADVQSHEMWMTSINSGEIAPWNKVFPVVGDSIFHGVIPSSTQSVTELADGEWGLASTTVANQLGLPFTQGTLKIMPIVSGKTLLGVANNADVQKPGLWVSSISGGEVATWKRVDSDGAAGAPGLKTVGVTLTAGSALDGTAGRVRVLAQVTAPVTRWRVHIESRRQVFSSTTDFTLGAVSVGKHSGNGNMTGTTSLKSGNTSVSGSSEWVSKWITNDLSEETLIDFTVSGTGLYSYQAGAYRLNGSTWEPAKEVPAAVWIEVETYAETPVVAMIGDSTGAGQGADRPVHESALHVAARNHGFIPMNYSYPGSTMESMTNPEHHIYKRWEHLAKPDSVIVQAGSNDIHGGTSTADLQTRFNNLAELARGISPVVFGATVKARYPNSGDFVPALTAHNTYVKTQPAGTRDYLDFYQAVSPSGTVASVDAADAAHLSTSGHQKLATAFDSVTVSRPSYSLPGTQTFQWNNMDDATSEGDYDISTYSDVRDLENRPPATPIPASARISVRLAGGTRLIQEWVGIITGGIGERWQRNRNSAGVWESWMLVHTDFSLVEDYVDSKSWFQRNILNGEDLNDFTKAGLYLITPSSTMSSLINRPFGANSPGFLTVVDSGGTIIQELTHYSDNGPVTMSRSTQGGVFQEWVNPAAVTKPFLWTDLNEAVIEGDYDIGRYSDVRDLENRPPATPIPAGARISVRLAGGTRLIQEWVGIITGGIGERWQRNRNSTGAWESWTLVHTDISRAEVLSLLEDFSPETVKTDHVLTVGDSQVGATYGWANLLADVSGQTVVNRGKSGNTPDEALLMTGGWRLPIEPVALIPGERVAVSFAGDYPVLGRDFGHNGYVLGKSVSLWYTHSTGGWEALLKEEEPLTLSEPTLWASIYADFAPEKLSRRIVWFGGNSIRTGRHRPDESLVEHVQKAYSRAIDAWGDTTIVCGYVPAYGDTVGRDAANELNTWLSHTVPTQFLDMRHRIQLAAADILGRALTTSEQRDIANGYVPRPLYRSDLVHLTDEAHVKIADIVAEFPQGASPQISIRSNPAPVVSLTATGFPEGKVAAPVGSTYTDTAATNGAIRWIKSSGTGNTGWTVEYGDTGWRNVSSELTNVIESGKVFLRRRGDTIDIATEWAKLIPAGTTQMPTGFTPFRNDAVPFYASSNLATPVAQFRISFTGTVTINVFDDRYSANDMGTFATEDPWPTTLPGIPS